MSKFRDPAELDAAANVIASEDLDASINLDYTPKTELEAKLVASIPGGEQYGSEWQKVFMDAVRPIINDIADPKMKTVVANTAVRFATMPSANLNKLFELNAILNNGSSTPTLAADVKKTLEPAIALLRNSGPSGMS